MTEEKRECEHEIIRFHSGDYHIGCSKCSAFWTITDAKKSSSAAFVSGIDRFAPQLDDGK
jgi:uncharacterized Zn finger protein